ncbi:MAG: cell division protein [Pseudomonadota bacterium]
MKLRTWAVWFTYASIAGHLLVGALLPFIANAALLDGYHRAIETAFWGPQIPAAARAQQVWWISLFGPTVQAAALWMGALAWIGDHQRNAFAWGALIAGLLLWAPQDMLISLRADCWPHVWIDSFALACMLPPLIYLFYIDRAKATP